MRGKEFRKASLELIDFYRKNPVIAAEDLLGVTLAVPQMVVLEDLWFKPYSIITACRGFGKTWILSVFSVLRAMLYPGDRIGLLSPSFRQSKFIFAEVQKRYENSPLLREACAKRPTMSADRCYLQFRAPKNRIGSLIEAMPLGTGEKIRGSRYYCILCDEMAQIPSDILDVVIRPMGATSPDPMARVKYKERLAEMEAIGIDASNLEYENVNKFIGVTSAYYTFNHAYLRIQKYEEEIKNGSNKHVVRYVTYKDLPDGFLDEDNIREAKAVMPKHLFEMEYEGIWRSDSEGVFKASLLESAKDDSCEILLAARRPKQYIMGVDPARSSDAFAICVVELGDPAKLVYVRKSSNNKFPEMADIIYTLAEKFNVSAIMMDAGAGGGGLALKDILADPTKYGSNVILDMDDPEYIETTGRKILRMFKPSSQTNAAAVNGSIALMEQGKLRLPTPPRKGIEAEDEVFAVIEELYTQLLSIVITETRSGLAHFDVAGGGHGGAKKDLYSAFILVSALLYEQVYNIQEDFSIHSVGGMLIPRTRDIGLPGRNHYYGY